jgi:hypothetical protein
VKKVTTEYDLFFQRSTVETTQGVKTWCSSGTVKPIK